MWRPADHRPDWAAIQEAFALGSPVLVIGPGCARIGFDETNEWAKVRTRVGAIWHALGDEETGDLARPFLKRLWLERLSDRTREQHEADILAIDPKARQDKDYKTVLPTRQDITSSGADLPNPERARILLATQLLLALAASTRYLGAVVEAGGVPVWDWERVWHSPAPDDPPTVNTWREHTASALRQAAALAAAIDRAKSESRPQDLNLQVRNVFDDNDLKLNQVTHDTWHLLKISAIRDSLETLHRTRFEVNARQVSGAIVEWLSDLFWHVVAVGAKVPPSQDELDFYVNLHTPMPDTDRQFTRPHPGEYRGPSDGWKTLTGDVTQLLKAYDSGATESPRDWDRARERFARTMAASLSQTWSHEQNGKHRLVIALVSDYDLMLERALFDSLREDQSFHVLIPVAVHASPAEAEVEWLYGSYLDPEGNRAESLAEPVTWERFRDVPAAGSRQPNGPIIVKLAGSPLHDIRGAEGLDWNGEINTVALFSEHDSVRAMRALLPPAGETPRGIQLNLLGADGLTWVGRSWLFFGHRYSDWLPRLQLLFTASMLAAGGSTPFGAKSRRDWRIAIDRSFDWPERALLDALEIRRELADLSEVSEYFKKNASHDHLGDDTLITQITTFHRGVRAAVKP